MADVGILGMRALARDLRVLPRPRIQKASTITAHIGELALTLVDLDSHWNTTVVGHTPTPIYSALRLRPSILVATLRTIRLIIERRQVLPVLDDHRRLMATQLLWVDLVALLVLLVLLLLVHVLLLLLHLLLPLRIHLLLYIHVVLRRCPLLLGLPHYQPALILVLGHVGVIVLVNVGLG